MNPWFASNFNFPLSGSVNQDLSPEYFFNSIKKENGNGDIEKAIFNSGASYGRQIGIISDVLSEIIAQIQLPDSTEVQKFKQLQENINKIKEIKHDGLEQHAESILDKLKENDPKTLNKLLKKYQSQAVE
ncbi:type 1 glutamine amidotransferase family protein [Vibrio nitrifigilis]|uniref:Uncharacterized protein n=1 Tax=Vibrio nitrifigilis TaxID=2789781 RepID=A0ABS0GJA2_9VIBR|nr:hypothetical protein [Vibrio nitrifigilis]MBF9002497.1 hypothetical protein [Vibrio nitrifigilis]